MQRSNGKLPGRPRKGRKYESRAVHKPDERGTGMTHWQDLWIACVAIYNGIGTRKVTLPIALKFRYHVFEHMDLARWLEKTFQPQNPPLNHN
jgi:hypothetical protein